MGTDFLGATVSAEVSHCYDTKSKNHHNCDKGKERGDAKGELEGVSEAKEMTKKEESTVDSDKRSRDKCCEDDNRLDKTNVGLGFVP